MFTSLLAVFLAVFPAPAQAQEEQSIQYACFGGLNDTDSPATLDCDSPSLLNVEPNLNASAIKKRRGFSRQASLTIATAPVSGSHSFIDSSGNRQDLVCHDHTCAKSTNGNAFSVILSTAGGASCVPKRWSFVDVGGTAYGANDCRDLIMKYDGTTRSSAVNIPQGSILELTQDRLAVGDILNAPNRVHYSSAGNYEAFTTGINPEDSFFDELGQPGDRIRGMKYLNGIMRIFKSNSVTACELGDQYNTRCAVEIPNIGTTDPASIVAANNSIFFRGQDKNFWEISPQGIRNLSLKIPNLVASQSGGISGGEKTNTQTTQADWLAGVQYPTGTWDTTTENGAIFNSSLTITETSDADFIDGTFTNTSTGTTDGYIVLAGSPTASLLDNFSDEELTSNPAWTEDGAFWAAGRISAGTSAGLTVACRAIDTNDYNSPQYTNGIRTTAGTPYGRWEINIYNGIPSPSAGSGFFIYQFIRDPGTGDGYSLNSNRLSGAGAFTLELYKRESGGSTLLSSATISGHNYQDTKKYEISRSSNGVFHAYYDGTLKLSATDQTYAPAVSDILVSIGGVNQGCSDPIVAVATVSASVYASTGNYLSSVFDTGFSTTTGGTLSVSSSTPAGTTLAFQLRSSPNGTSNWSAWTTIANGERITETNRYWQYFSSFTTSIGTVTPNIADVALAVSSTGTFRTTCIEPNSSISAWGILSCAQTTTGNSSFVYYATSAVSCATLPTTDPTQWQTSVTNNGTLSIDTNTAVYIGWRNLLTSATEQTRIDSCILNWTEGAGSQPVWAAFDSVNNAIYWTSTINNALYSNRLLKYDLNLHNSTVSPWYPFDIQAQAPRVINNTLYFGGASSGTWSAYGLNDNDNGMPITAYWKSKDFGAPDIFVEKSWTKISVLARNQGSGTLSITPTSSNGDTTSYSISLATTTGINYIRKTDNLPLWTPHNFINTEFRDASDNNPFEVLGLRIDFIPTPWLPGNP